MNKEHIVEEETIEEQVFFRDVRELEKALVLSSRLYQLLQKRAQTWNMEAPKEHIEAITKRLFYVLFDVGFDSVFDKYSQILKVLGTTKEEVIAECKR